MDSSQREVFIKNNLIDTPPRYGFSQILKSVAICAVNALSGVVCPVFFIVIQSKIGWQASATASISYARL